MVKTQHLLAVDHFQQVTRYGPLPRRLAGLRRDHDLNNLDGVIALNSVFPNAANPGKPLAVGQVCKARIPFLDHHVTHDFVKVSVTSNLGAKDLVAGGGRHGPKCLGLENKIRYFGQVRCLWQVHHCDRLDCSVENRALALGKVCTTALCRVVCPDVSFQHFSTRVLRHRVVIRDPELCAAHADQRCRGLDLQWRAALDIFCSQRFQYAGAQAHQAREPVGGATDSCVATQAIASAGGQFSQSVGQHGDPAAVREFEYSRAVASGLQLASLGYRRTHARFDTPQLHVARSADQRGVQRKQFHQARRDFQYLPRLNGVRILHLVEDDDLFPVVG